MWKMCVFCSDWKLNGPLVLMASPLSSGLPALKGLAVASISSRLLTGYKTRFSERLPTTTVPVPLPLAPMLKVPEPPVRLDPSVPVSFVSAATLLHAPALALAEPAIANLPPVESQPLKPKAYCPLTPEFWKVEVS